MQADGHQDAEREDQHSDPEAHAVVLPSVVTARRQLGGRSPRPLLGGQHVGTPSGRFLTSCVVEHPRDRVDDARERQPTRRGTPPRTPRWPRCRRAGAVPPASPALPGQPDGGEGVVVQRHELPGRRGRPVAAGGGAGHPVGPGQRRARSAAACPAGWPGRASSRRRTRPSSGRSTAGARRRRSGRSGTSNSRCASISSRPLLTSVAELIVTTGPMSQVGWASACSTVTSASSSRRRPRNGPPLAVRTRRRDLVGAARRAGTGPAPSARSRPGRSGPGAAAALTSGPPAISDSLLASASVRPASSAASVGPSPIEPVMPLSTTSQGQRASSVAASGPARIFGSGYSPASYPPAFGRGVERQLQVLRGAGPGDGDDLDPSSSACAASSATFAPPAASPTTRNRSGWARTTSSAWVPIEPVDPSTTTSRQTGGALTPPVSGTASDPTRVAGQRAQYLTPTQKTRCDKADISPGRMPTFCPGHPCTGVTVPSTPSEGTCICAEHAAPSSEPPSPCSAGALAVGGTPTAASGASGPATRRRDPRRGHQQRRVRQGRRLLDDLPDAARQAGRANRRPPPRRTARWTAGQKTKVEAQPSIHDIDRVHHGQGLLHPRRR